MRKLIAVICLIAAAACLFAGCGTSNEDTEVVIRTPSSTEPWIPVPTMVPGSTPAPTATPAPSGSAPQATGEAGETDAPHVIVEPDYSVFDDAAFIGNSTFEGLYRYGVITHGVFYTKVGLNVLTVHTAHTDKGKVPIIDELYNDVYGKVILMFGENELGWPSPSSYIEKYSELIDAVWLRQPDTEIYVVAMPPVWAGYSESSMGVNNDNIQNFNAMMQDLAERRGCHYIDVPKELMTYDGALPREASADGLHLNLQYARYWADHICLCVMGVYD